MSSHTRATRRRLFCPKVDGLESRELLNAAPGSMAEIAVASHHQTHGTPLVPQLSTAQMVTLSTIPANGDLNPYGITFVPANFPRGGVLQPGDLLISNFNNSANLQGTGTTIIRIARDGTMSTFFTGPSGVGLTTALGVLKKGFVIVGSLPTTDGTSSTVQQGSMLVVDRNGNLVANLSDSKFLNGPWDLTINDKGSTAQVFVSEVLSGAVSRFDLKLTGRNVRLVRAVQIASGFTHRTDPAALVIGPTGLAFDAKKNVLYVASTGDNEIFAIPHAGTTRHDQGTGKVVVMDDVHLHGPLGLLLAPNGNLIAANGDGVNSDMNQPSEITEFTIKGTFVGQFSIAPQPDGPFGIALTSAGKDLLFAAVNDDTNSVTIWRVHR